MRVAVLGGGQLARMLALAGLPLGVRCRCLDPAVAAPAGHAGELIVGAYDDPAALARLAADAAVCTFEFENVPTTTASWLEQHIAVRPHPRALAIGQDRLAEKQLFARLGIPVTAHRPAGTAAELQRAVAAVGAPCIVKTRRLGYDGRGQVRLTPGAGLAAAVDAAHAALTADNNGGLIVERLVPFDRELSVLGVRGSDGSTAVYPLVENDHADGILRRSRAPAPRTTAALQGRAVELAHAVLGELDYVGVLAIELFDVSGELWANELAPRVHNSGHWTIEGARCSQFENHLRAVLGLPLGSCEPTGAAATMINFIGHLPERRAVLALPGVHVHTYGKQPRPGRKVGHATVVGDDRAAVDALADRAAALPPASTPW